MTLYLDLLRHGETERGGGFRGSLDDELTPVGWAQMQQALVGAGPWDRVISSPLRRCAAFAHELASASDIPLHLEHDLRELHFGAWEGRSAAEIMTANADDLGRFWNDPYAFTPPAGEPVMQFDARVLAAVERLYHAFNGQRVLLIGHGGVMRLLLARARGLPREQLLQVEVGHGALRRLELRAPRAFLEPCPG